MNITYGCCNPEDIERLNELETACFTEQFRWTKEDLIESLKTGDVWLLRTDEKIVGYILVELRRKRGHVISVGVDPTCQRKGYGKALMDEAKAFYTKFGVKDMRLEVHQDNPAQMLYFKLGYRVTNVRKDYYADGSSAVIMSLLL